MEHEAIRVERLYTPTAHEREAIITIEGESFSNPWTADTFDAMMNVPVSQLYVARLGDGAVVGFCACWFIAHELHVNTLAIQRALRRRGYGSRLMREALALSGATRATLEVRESNVAARALYERLGFTVTAIRPRYYQEPEEDGLILWLNP